jgi:hypothetical protein
MLRAAYRRQRASGGGPDWTEAVAIRHALSVLGARQEVLPPLTASSATTAGSIQRAWPAAQLVDVINDLADHNQAVLYFMLWTVIDGGTFWSGHESLDQPLGLDKPWRQVVEDARETMLIEAAFVVPRPNLFATVEWIDHEGEAGLAAVEVSVGGVGRSGQRPISSASRPGGGAVVVTAPSRASRSAAGELEAGDAGLPAGGGGCLAGGGVVLVDVPEGAVVGRV